MVSSGYTQSEAPGVRGCWRPAEWPAWLTRCLQPAYAPETPPPHAATGRDAGPRSHTAVVPGLPSRVGARHALPRARASIQRRCGTPPAFIQAVGKSSTVEHLWQRLPLLVTPCAEIAGALAMRLAALRVRTPLGPERDVTSSAPLPHASKRVWPSEQARQGWPLSEVVSRPCYGNSLHDASPSLLWAGALCPAPGLARNIPRVWGRPYARGHIRCVTSLTHQSGGRQRGHAAADRRQGSGARSRRTPAGSFPRARVLADVLLQGACSGCYTLPLPSAEPPSQPASVCGVAVAAGVPGGWSGGRSHMTISVGRVPIFPVRFPAKPGVKWPSVATSATDPLCSTTTTEVWPRHWPDTKRGLPFSSGD